MWEVWSELEITNTHLTNHLLFQFSQYLQFYPVPSPQSPIPGSSLAIAEMPILW
ncbi:MAG: hypothetical protein SAK42_07010 [Oscillatoria sp. PMC 1076.18]|nr:hypothetical protein [Oscillatoria sp. PMC 1076.18]